MLTIEIQPRKENESAEMLRERGVVPAVFYGPKEVSTAIAIDAKAFEKIWREAGMTSVVTLHGEGGDKDTLIHDVQVHPVTGKPIHADFYVLEKGKKVEVAIPLEFDGQAPAEKLGHIVVKALHELEIEVAPAELPKHLIVDISTLENVGDRILASDVKLPSSAKLITDPEEILVSITEMKEEAEASAPAAAEGEAAPEAAPEEKTE